MSSDETFALLVCVGFALIGCVRWLYLVSMSPPMGWPMMLRAWLLLVPTGCVILMVVLLHTYAAHDVRDSVIYMFFYSVMGIAWVYVTLMPAAFLGLNLRGDIIDRRNTAAAWAGAGLVLGLTLGFTGGNIGDGPGWWVVIFCAILETAALYTLWLLCEPFAHFTESITVERDTSAGIRFAALMVASGLILGRAVAGDWVSASATVDDFSHDALGVCLVWAFAVLLETILRPKPQRPPGNELVFGVLPGLVYLGGAAWWLTYVGWWS